MPRSDDNTEFEKRRSDIIAYKRSERGDGLTKQTINYLVLIWIIALLVVIIF